MLFSRYATGLNSPNHVALRENVGESLERSILSDFAGFAYSTEDASPRFVPRPARVRPELSVFDSMFRGETVVPIESAYQGTIGIRFTCLGVPDAG